MAELRQRKGPQNLWEAEGGVRKRVVEQPTDWKLLGTIIAVPFACLVVLYPTLRYIYFEPIAAKPCVGVCDISALEPSAPEGCKPSNPKQLQFIHIPKTGGTSMGSLIEARKHDKEWEFIFVREWRDAVPDGVVWLPPHKIRGTSPETYENIFKERFTAQSYAKRPHRSVMHGHSYFHDFSVPLIPDAHEDFHAKFPPKSEGEMDHVVMLREPISRMASQYAFDRSGAKTRGFQAMVKDQRGDLPFTDCLKSAECMAQNYITRWCNIQTLYLCGWGEECAPRLRDRVTQATLDKAKLNLKNFALVTLLEEWDKSVLLMEKVLPTYFEGLMKEYDEGNKNNCESWVERWQGKKCPYKRNVGKKSYGIPDDDHSQEMLKHVCWADIELYKYAQELFASKVDACGFS